ncbi:hypothetical protein DX130_00205 [Paenibacillus paeoniae]|uniref:Uncharacterized protein n=1 Tax=Paenibacillus paeoniae TaxID=2292705 RepID=A0A371PHE1_9BACL|nr:hypothetical protein DX130_00205 [Paenibacillus paeoniae]
MLTILIGVLLICICVLVIFRMIKYKFIKLNKENLGLIIIMGVLVHLIKLRSDILIFPWYYLLLGLVILLFCVVIIGMLISKNNPKAN